MQRIYNFFLISKGSDNAELYYLKSHILFSLKKIMYTNFPRKSSKNKKKISNILILKWENLENTLEECPIKYSV